MDPVYDAAVRGVVAMASAADSVHDGYLRVRGVPAVERSVERGRRLALRADDAQRRLRGEDSLSRKLDKDTPLRRWLGRKNDTAPSLIRAFESYNYQVCTRCHPQVKELVMEDAEWTAWFLAPTECANCTRQLRRGWQGAGSQVLPPTQVCKIQIDAKTYKNLHNLANIKASKMTRDTQNALINAIDTRDGHPDVQSVILYVLQMQGTRLVEQTTCCGRPEFARWSEKMIQQFDTPAIATAFVESLTVPKAWAKNRPEEKGSEESTPPSASDGEPKPQSPHVKAAAAARANAPVAPVKNPWSTKSRAIRLAKTGEGTEMQPQKPAKTGELENPAKAAASSEAIVQAKIALRAHISFTQDTGGVYPTTHVVAGKTAVLDTFKELARMDQVAVAATEGAEPLAGLSVAPGETAMAIAVPTTVATGPTADAGGLVPNVQDPRQVSRSAEGRFDPKPDKRWKPHSHVSVRKRDITKVKGWIAHQANLCTNFAAGVAKPIFLKHPAANTYKNRPKVHRPDWKHYGSISVHESGDTTVVNLYAQWAGGKVSDGPHDRDGRVQRLEKFHMALNSLGIAMRAKSVKEVYMPKGIGCVKAGGHWPDYLAVLKRFATEYDVQVVLCDPYAREWEVEGYDALSYTPGTVCANNMERFSGAFLNNVISQERMEESFVAMYGMVAPFECPAGKYNAQEMANAREGLAYSCEEMRVRNANGKLESVCKHGKTCRSVVDNGPEAFCANLSMGKLLEDLTYGVERGALRRLSIKHKRRVDYVGAWASKMTSDGMMGWEIDQTAMECHERSPGTLALWHACVKKVGNFLAGKWAGIYQRQVDFRLEKDTELGLRMSMTVNNVAGAVDGKKRINLQFKDMFLDSGWLLTSWVNFCNECGATLSSIFSNPEHLFCLNPATGKLRVQEGTFDWSFKPLPVLVDEEKGIWEQPKAKSVKFEAAFEGDDGAGRIEAFCDPKHLANTVSWRMADIGFSAKFKCVVTGRLEFVGLHLRVQDGKLDPSFPIVPAVARTLNKLGVHPMAASTAPDMIYATAGARYASLAVMFAGRVDPMSVACLHLAYSCAQRSSRHSRQKKAIRVTEWGAEHLVDAGFKAGEKVDLESVLRAAERQIREIQDSAPDTVFRPSDVVNGESSAIRPVTYDRKQQMFAVFNSLEVEVPEGQKNVSAATLGFEMDRWAMAMLEYDGDDLQALAAVPRIFGASEI